MTVNVRQTGSTVQFERIVDAGYFSDKQNAVYRDVVKRALDVTLVLLVAIPLLPFLAVVMFLIARDGHSPLYLQERVGRNGRPFRMWKLRSMVPDAEARLQDYLDANPVARMEWDATQKLKHDPRITRIGRIIRKCSIDELPQLWNVLTGEMSLVGPRPMMANQRSLYPGLAYYALRPGITGFWQTSVRNDSNFTDRANHDTRYFRELSLGTDVRLLGQTVRVVMKGTGY